MLLVLHQNGELTLQDVERIGVLLVNVGPRPGPRAVVPRLRDAELLEGGLDHDPAAEHGLALPRAMNDPSMPRV
jgi:hypothetical protein